MQNQTKTCEQLAREITVAAIEKGHCGGGDPAETIGTFYEGMATGLQRVELEHGSEAMNAAAQFATAAIEAGLVYVGDEVFGFLGQLAARVRGVSRDLGTGSTRL